MQKLYLKYNQIIFYIIINSVHTKVNKHLAEALPHVLWHRQDAGNIVVKERVLLLKQERNILFAKSETYKIHNLTMMANIWTFKTKKEKTISSTTL